MRALELVDRAALRRPPRRVVPRQHLRLEHDRHPGPFQQRDIRLSLRDRIQLIPPAINNVGRHVDQVGEVELAVDAEIRVGQHAERAIQRKERRPRCGLPHAEIERAGTAVRDAHQMHAVLVDVVGSFQPREDRFQVVELHHAPPRRLAEPGRVHGDAAWRDVEPPPRRPRVAFDRRARDAAVQVHPHRVLHFRVVITRDDDRRRQPRAARDDRLPRQLARRHIARVRAGPRPAVCGLRRSWRRSR